MKQKTYCQNEILPVLVRHLTEATKSIQLAIGWINDDGLSGLLQKKSLEGVNVKVLLLNEQKNSPTTRFRQLTKKGIEVIWLPENQREYFIDHKFAVIDTGIVLTGNYLWNFNTVSTEESLTITETTPSLAQGYALEFKRLTKLNPDAENEPKSILWISTVLRKLEIIKVLLDIGDTEFIDIRLKELSNPDNDENVAAILNALSVQSYDEALILIQKFIRFHRTLQDCLDPPVDNLRREIQRIEEEIAQISNEYSETQKTLHKFSKLHSEHLGSLLQKILFHTKIKTEIEAKINAEKQDASDQAKKDYEEYTKSYQFSKEQKLADLSPKEQKELRKLYRQTSLKCHPDRVIDELYEQAEAIFVELNMAYKANDLKRLREINQELKSGTMLSKSESITELKKLESTCKGLAKTLEGWGEKLATLKEVPTYQTIARIEDWEVYFEETKAALKSQLERLLVFNEANQTLLG